MELLVRGPWAVELRRLLQNMTDISPELAEKGKEKIAKQLSGLEAKGKMSHEEIIAILSRIETGTKSICRNCDLIIEAAVEDIQVKKQTFMELEEIVPENCMFTSNTSSLSITEIGNELKRPVAGMHFFNPAPVLKLVEVIAGMNTPAEMIRKIKDIAADIGKVPVEVQEGPGFVVNRILIPMINEAIGIYADGLASAQDIDTAMKLGASHPMGPLALGDLVGLDVVLAIMNVLYDETKDTKYRPHPLLIKMVRGGLLGRKSGKGFFNY